MSLYGKLGGALLSVLLAGGGAVYLSAAQKETATQSVSAEAESYYILRLFDGNIALFKDGSDIPEVVYSMPVEFLNKADLALLEEGIRLNGISDVLRLIEDLELE